MKTKTLLLLLLCGPFHGLFLGSVHAAESTNPLLGAWHLTGVEWQSTQRTSALTNVQPGLFIFTENHYALMWSPINEPRTPFKVLSKPTDEETIAGFKSVVFNGGSYQYAEGELVTTAEIAKVPGFETGQQFFKADAQGDQLTLTFYDEVYPDGSKPEWAGKWRTVFTLKKASD